MLERRTQSRLHNRIGIKIDILNKNGRKWKDETRLVKWRKKCTILIG